MSRIFSITDTFSRVVWGTLLWFFDELGVYIHAKGSHFEIIHTSTKSVSKHKIPYTNHFTACVKHNTLFFVGPVLKSKSPVYGKCYFYALDPHTDTCRRITVPGHYEFLSIFLSPDENHVTLIHCDGPVFRINTSDLAVEQVVNLDNLHPKGCYTHNGRFYLPSFYGGWNNTGEDIYEYLRCQDGEEYFRLRLNLSHKSIECLPLPVSEEFRKWNGLDAWLYNNKLDISYSANNFNHGSNSNKIRYEFTRSDKHLFSFEIEAGYVSIGRMIPMGNKHMVTFCSRSSILYLVDIDKQEVRSLELSGKEIMDVFVNEHSGYIIPVFLYGGARLAYTAEDFKSTVIIN